MYVCNSPHVDVKGLGLVDLEAPGPGAVGGVHASHTQQLVIVVAGPVEDDAGARQGGDVTLRVGRTLGQMYSLMTNGFRRVTFIILLLD